MLKKSASFLCLLSLLLLTAGCATSRPLGSIPHDAQDFKLSLEELKEKYPEIAVYEKKSFSFGYRTPVREVIDQWGEPDNKKILWGQHLLPLSPLPIMGVAGVSAPALLAAAGAFIVMVPVPSSSYSWEKGDYVIEAVIDSSIFGGYMKHLRFWEWKNRKEVKTADPRSESNEKGKESNP